MSYGAYDHEFAVKSCTPHPNGTYDLKPILCRNTVRYEWGNSLLLSPDISKRTKMLLDMYDEQPYKITPEQMTDYLKLETVIVMYPDD